MRHAASCVSTLSNGYYRKLLFIIACIAGCTTCMCIKARTHQKLITFLENCTALSSEKFPAFLTMPRILIAVTLAFLLLERAASQLPTQECTNAIAQLTTACAGVTDICSGACRDAYEDVFSSCSEAVSSYIAT